VEKALTGADRTPGTPADLEDGDLLYHEVALVSALIAFDGGSPVAVGGGDWHGRAGWSR